MFFSTRAISKTARAALDAPPLSFYFLRGLRVCHNRAYYVRIGLADGRAYPIDNMRDLARAAEKDSACIMNSDIPGYERNSHRVVFGDEIPVVPGRVEEGVNS
jgi:hypothetical protein